MTQLVIPWSRENRIIQCDSTYTTSSAGNVKTFTNELNKGANYRDWRRRLANGEQCTTTLSGTMYSRSHSRAAFSAKATPKFGFITCQSFPYVAANAGFVDGADIPIGPATNNTSTQKADTQALTAFVRKLREAQTTFQGGVFTGEIRETLRMLSSPAKSLRKGISAYLAALKKRQRHVRRSKFRKKLPTARKILADTWLEYSFGFRPLVNDINDIARTIAEAKDPLVERWRPITANGVDEVRSSSFAELYSGSLISSMGVLYEAYAKKEVIYRGSVSIENPFRPVWQRFGNFTEDFLPTVWELIPYSFLADYFSNIGDIISAACYVRSKLRWAARTEVDFSYSKVKSTYIVPNSSAFFGITANCGSVQEYREKKSFSRAPYTGSLIPNLEFTIPGFGTKWINMAALLVASKSLTPYHR